PVQHYWSVAVEEQFYLIWPFLMLVAAWLHRRKGWSLARTTTIVLGGVVLVPSLAWSVSYTGGFSSRGVLRDDHAAVGAGDRCVRRRRRRSAGAEHPTLGGGEVRRPHRDRGHGGARRRTSGMAELLGAPPHRGHCGGDRRRGRDVGV